MTHELPRLKEPYLSPLQDKESIAPPPPAFGQSSLAPLPGSAIAGLTEAPKATAQAGTPAPVFVDSSTPALTPAERRAAGARRQGRRRARSDRAA